MLAKIVLFQCVGMNVSVVNSLEVEETKNKLVPLADLVGLQVFCVYGFGEKWSKLKESE